MSIWIFVEIKLGKLHIGDKSAIQIPHFTVKKADFFVFRLSLTFRPNKVSHTCKPYIFLIIDPVPIPSVDLPSCFLSPYIWLIGEEFYH